MRNTDKNLYMKKKATTVGELRRSIKGLPENMPIYWADHDHGEYEHNSRVGTSEVKNQIEARPEQVGKEFKIEGSYLLFRP